MEIAKINIGFNSGEHMYRTLNISVDDALTQNEIRLAFITPKGRHFLSETLTLENGKAQYAVPSALLDGAGRLYAQVIAYTKGEFAAKSEIVCFYVDKSLDIWDELSADADGLFAEDIADRLADIEKTVAKAYPVKLSEFENDMNFATVKYVNSKTVSMPFKGKICNVLGDSQTEANEHKTKIYHDWLKELLGLAAVNNYGISGSTIAKKSATDTAAISEQYKNMPDADLIIVMGGVNDVWFSSAMGTIGDTDATTFYGGMEQLCSGLISKYPGKTIIFITPTEQDNESCTSSCTTGLTVTDFAEAMKKVCAKYAIPVYDANTLVGIYPKNAEQRKLYTTDGVHLNDKANERLGRAVYKFIMSMYMGDETAADTDSGTDTGSDTGSDTGTDTGSDTGTDTDSDIGDDGYEGLYCHVAKCYDNSGLVHLTMTVKVDDDIKAGTKITWDFEGSETNKMVSCSHSINVGVFESDTYEADDGVLGAQLATCYDWIQTVSDDGKLTVNNADWTLSKTPSSQYLKVPIALYANVGASFKIAKLRLYANGVEKQIIKCGACFDETKARIYFSRYGTTEE